MCSCIFLNWFTASKPKAYWQAISDPPQLGHKSQMLLVASSSLHVHSSSSPCLLSSPISNDMQSSGGRSDAWVRFTTKPDAASHNRCGSCIQLVLFPSVAMEDATQMPPQRQWPSAGGGVGGGGPDGSPAARLLTLRIRWPTAICASPSG